MALSQKLLLISFISFGLASCAETPRDHVQVSGPIVVPANSKFIIKSPKPLAAPNVWNALCLLPADPKQLPPDGFTFRAADGSTFIPKVAVRNAQGIEDSLTIVGGLGAEGGVWLCFFDSTGQVLHAPFTDVVLVSPKELSLKAVKWHSSDK